MGWTGRSLVDKVLRAMEEHREQRGEYVRGLRKRRGWSAEDLAHAAGVSTKTIYRLEKGKVEDPQGKTTSGVARALGVSESEVRGEPVLPTPEEVAQLDRIEAIVEETREIARRLLQHTEDAPT